MGRSPLPLRIIIPPSLWEWPVLQALKDQGHLLIVLTELEHADLILSPVAWRMDKELEPYLLSHAIPATRKLVRARPAA